MVSLRELLHYAITNGPYAGEKHVAHGHTLEEPHATVPRHQQAQRLKHPYGQLEVFLGILGAIVNHSPLVHGRAHEHKHLLGPFSKTIHVHHKPSQT